MPEEIIIDGVNVAECEYMLNNKIKGKQHCPAKAMPYAKETSCICRKSIDTPYNFCKHNPNCHYKQLKRLEQERDELKKACEKCKLFDIEKTNRDLLEQIDKLEQENKALNFKINQLKANGLYNDLTGIELSAKVVELEQENKKLKEEVASFMNGDYCANGCKKMNNTFRDAHTIFINQNNTYRSALQEIRDNFMCFRSCMIPFHIGNKNNMPHSMADAIQDYCESIKNKINEALK